MLRNIFIFCACTISAIAQNKISGTIRDGDTKSPLPGAVISFPEISRATTTDSDGNFSMHLPRGKVYQVTASYIGYKSFNGKFSLGSDTSFQLYLDRGVELNEITVSGAYTGRQDQTPQPIEVARLDQAHLLGASTVMDVISKVPGVNALNTGPFLSRPVIRGLSGNRILVANGGMRFETQQWDDEHGIGVNELGMERVEIIKGPASLLFGPEAMGGVINFIDQSPAAAGTKEAEVNASAFSNNLGANVRGDLKGATEKYFWSVNLLNRAQSDYYYRNYDMRVPNSRMSEFGGRLTGGISRKWGSTSLSYLFNQAFYGILDVKDIVLRPDGTIFNKDTAEKEMFPGEVEAPYHSVQDHRITSRTTLIAGKSQVKMLFGYQLNNRAEYEEGGPVPKEGYLYTGMNLQSATYDVKWFLPALANFTTIAGVQGMYQENHNDASASSTLIPDAFISDAGGVIMTKYSRSRLNIVAGARYDMRHLATSGVGSRDGFGRDYSNISRGAGISYDLSGKLVIRLNYATGYRPPNLNELAASGFKFESRSYEFGNAGFHKEHNEQMDAGLAWRGKNFSLIVSAFRNLLMNYIYLEYQPNSALPVFPTFAFRQANALLTGGEAGVDLHPRKADWLKIELLASVLEARRTDDRSYLPMMPSDKITASITLAKRSKGKWRDLFLRAGSFTALFQRKVSPGELKTPDYTLVSLSFGATRAIWKLEKVTFTLAVNNLLDQVYYDNLSRLRYYGIANQGRNVALSIRIPLIFHHKK